MKEWLGDILNLKFTSILMLRNQQIVIVDGIVKDPVFIQDNVH